MPRVPDALVVGAGPVGLTAALALRAQGMDVIVLEAGHEARERPGSRAIFYHQQTLGLWEQIRPGLGWEVAGAGLIWLTKRTFWGERQVYEKTYPLPRSGVLPHSTNLAQSELERILLLHCKAVGVELAWNQQVIGVRASPEGVTLETSDGRAWEARYVVAADGGRSVVRKELGIDLKGPRLDDAFVIVDVADNLDLPIRPERVYYYAHPAVQGRNVLVVPFRNGVRADIQLRRGDDPNRFNDPREVREWLVRMLPEGYANRVTWISTYQFLQVVAESFTDRSRRVFLVGEAAHLFAPFGARGLNSGVADAAAAARAIRLALDSRAQSEADKVMFDAAVLRRNAAMYNRNASSLALEHMRARDWRIRARRSVSAWLARQGARAGSYLDSAPFGPRAAAKGSSDGIY